MRAREKGKNYAITKEQVIAGRAIIGWSRQRLSEESGVSMRTLARFEEGESSVSEGLMFSIWNALSAGGVVFIPTNGEGPGVRLKKKV